MSFKRKPKLTASDDFVTCVGARPDGSPITRPAGAVPLPRWPDGRWCAELALFLRQAALRNLSRLSRGGTLSTYFYNISPLIRFCWKRNISFHKLTDTDFADFINGQIKESRAVGRERVAVRSSSSVLDIGRRCLDFIEFAGQLHAVPNHIGKSGCLISAERRQELVGPRDSDRKKVVDVWYHNSFPLRGETRTRHAIGFEYIARLRRAAVKFGKSSFIKQRRLVLLRLLEATGGRRSEIARITAFDIEEALKSPSLTLKLYSAKRKGEDQSTDPHRFVSVRLNDLDYIKRYIDVFRAPVIDATLGQVGDDGIVLISETTGRGLKADTITNEIRQLRIYAEITGKAHPHIFRHRFVTIRLMNLIREHKLSNRSEFELLFKLEGFKKQVAEETGHKSLASLNVYIDWAFIELAGGDEESRVRIDLRQIAASVESSYAEVLALKETLSTEEFTLELMRRYESIVRDVGGTLSKRERASGSKLLDDVTQ